MRLSQSLLGKNIEFACSGFKGVLARAPYLLKGHPALGLAMMTGPRMTQPQNPPLDQACCFNRRHIGWHVGVGQGVRCDNVFEQDYGVG